MGEIFRNIILLLLVTNALIPFLIAWILIKYVFYLRQRQNDQFLNDLGHVVHDATLDALKDNESAKRYPKTTQTNYNPKNK